MLGVRRCHLVSIALLALATTAGAQSSDNSGPRTDLALQDAIARALEAEGLDGRHPEFGDLQREEDGALAGMGEEPLRSPLGLGAGVPMEGPRRISERGKKALLEEMMKRNGM